MTRPTFFYLCSSRIRTVLDWSPLHLCVLCCCPAGSWTPWGCLQPWLWCRASSWAQCGLERTELWLVTSRGRTPQHLWSLLWSSATSWSQCWGASWFLCLQSLYPLLVSSKILWWGKFYDPAKIIAITNKMHAAAVWFLAEAYRLIKPN